MSDEKPEKSNKLDTYCALLLAVFAAALAITDLGAGRYGGDEMIAVNEKSNANMWYQAKSIKQSLTEGNKELFNALLIGGVIEEEKRPAFRGIIDTLNLEIARYKKEKKEILLGSSVVGKENWAQDINGELGIVVGAKEWEVIALKLGKAGDYFDGAILFLQLCLVMGAISLISPTDKSKRNFFIGMIVLGVMGSVITSIAFVMAS